MILNQRKYSRKN